MMSTQERVDAALAILEAEQTQSNVLPATVIMPPDSGDFIIGNPEGFVHLAIASLRAAKGEKQSFKDHSWWVNYELDWAIPGLKPDSSAHIYLGNARSVRHPFSSLRLFNSLSYSVRTIGLASCCSR
jgi:hypothetical protein